MATTRGRETIKRFIAGVPVALKQVLRGAARAGATVIAAEARARSISPEVAEDVKVATRREDDRMVGLVQVKGPHAFIAPWLEYGTDGHFISVDDSQRGGRSVGRINDLAKTGSLVINGVFVGKTVWHPGARPHPFMRTALDQSESAALAAAQAHIAKRVTRRGLAAGDEGDAE